MKPFIKNYQFELVLRNVYEDTPGLEDTLFEAGCDDALISYRNGIVCLSFDRQSTDLQEAILSAISDVEKCALQPKVDHVEGAFFNLSDIAKKTGLTKQAISLFIKGQRGKGRFPVPFSGIHSSSPIWRWSEVIQWLYEQNKIQDKQLLNEAQVIDIINLKLLLRSIDQGDMKRCFLA